MQCVDEKFHARAGHVDFVKNKRPAESLEPAGDFRDGDKWKLKLHGRMGVVDMRRDRRGSGHFCDDNE